MSAEPFGTFASTLRARWTLQRCQVAPSITELIASRSPRCASEITSLTPVSPRARSAAEERDPERAVFGVADFDAEDFPVTAAGHAGGHYHRLGHDPPAAAGLDVGGVEEHIRELDMIEGPVPERLERLVELRADAAHFALGDPRRRAERLDEVVDLAGRHAVHVGLHHHREQGPIDPAAPLEDRREETPVAQLRDRQLHIAGLRRQQLRASPVALVRAALGAFVRTGADHLGCFRVDERLEDHLHTRTDQIDIATRTAARRGARTGQTVQGPPCDLLLHDLWTDHTEVHAVAHLTGGPSGVTPLQGARPVDRVVVFVSRLVFGTERGSSR